MDLKLNDKRALITGSSSGIGEGIAKALAQEGATVVVHGRKEEQANWIAEEIAAGGGKAFVAVGDLAIDKGARQVVDQALSAVGNVDILINNAAMFHDDSWMETSPNQWLETYNANVVSMVRLIQLLVPQMKQLGWGRIIQISSGLATQPFTTQPDYEASKAAVLNLTVSLAKELAQTGITVNSVSPGLILTSKSERMMREMAKSKGWGSDWAEIEKQALQELWPNPTGRMGRVEDVANLATYLASPLAGYINSANLRVDGGGVVTIN